MRPGKPEAVHRSAGAVVADSQPQAMQESIAFENGMSMEEARQEESSQDPGKLLCSVFAHEIANSLHGIFAVAGCMERHLYEIGHIDMPTGESLRLVKEEINRLALAC
jgi:nitrogen-specific signal transduction histidine kinase